MLVPDTNTRAQCTGDDQSAPLTYLLTYLLVFSSLAESSVPYFPPHAKVPHLGLACNMQTVGSQTGRIAHSSLLSLRLERLHMLSFAALRRRYFASSDPASPPWPKMPTELPALLAAIDSLRSTLQRAIALASPRVALA